MLFSSRLRWVPVAVLAALLSLGVGPCQFGFGTPILQFRSPLAGQLSAPGDILVELQASGAVPTTSRCASTTS